MTPPSPSAGEPEQARRQARREFIRTHHPDVGGDQARFVAGLAEIDAAPAPAPVPPRPRVSVVPDQPWPISIITSIVRRVRRRRRPPRVR